MSIFQSKRPKIPLEKLEKSGLERFFSILSTLLFIGGVAFLVGMWSSIPAQVPAHFNAGGEITRHGSKWELIILPFVGGGLYLLMHVIEKYPHLHNYPIEITEANAEAAYRISRSMVSFLKNGILILFTILLINSMVIALGWGEGLGILLLPLIIVLSVVPLFIAIAKLIQLSS